jgi:2,3-bisphosphoglycerate-independent phosphoglycerate mutase
MKSIIVIGDGMSDRPVARLGGKTPLQVVKKPAIDRVARLGRCGLFRNIRPGDDNGSALANLAVLGYDPATCYQGRAVLEAANMGVALGKDDVALRCNVIHVTGDGLIKNHSAGHISTEEAAQLIADLERELGGGRGPLPVTFHAGVSYRHLLVLRGAWADPALACAEPHDHVGAKIEDLFPRATAPAAKPAEARLLDLYRRALPILAGHPVNKARAAAGKDTANAIWPWSAGRKPTMPTFQERFGVRGAVISAVDLINGLGRYAGMDVVQVPGATGLWDTNYEGKADAALKAIEDHDLVYVHVEASDEAGHACDLDLKIRCIEMLDARLVARVLAGLEARKLEATVAVLPDHPTPVETGKHASDPVPVAIWNPKLPPDGATAYDEESVKAGSLGMLEGDRFIRLALGR